MASSPITSWQIDGETMETVTDFIFFSSKITADGDCSHEIKRHLLLGRKGMTNLDRILKSRDITLPTKIHLVKAMVFPVVMYGCENWTIKKAEHQRIDALELWCWRSCSPLNCKEVKPVNPRWNQPWIFNGKTDAEAEALILWPPDVKNWLTGKDSDARQCVKKQKHHFADKGLCSQSYFFFFLKKAECRRIDTFELWCWRRLLSPLFCKEIKPFNPKGNQSWIFIGRRCWSWSSNTLATWCEELTLWKRP